MNRFIYISYIDIYGRKKSSFVGFPVHSVFDDVSARDLAQLGSQMTYSQTRINITGKPTRNRQKRKIFIVKETCFLSNIKFKISFQTHLASQESTVVSFFIGIPFLFPHKNSLCFHFHILDRDSTKNTSKLVGLIENNAFFFLHVFLLFFPDLPNGNTNYLSNLFCSKTCFGIKP